MDKEERKVEKSSVCDYKRFYAIRDKVANDISELWSSNNNASALRSFNFTISEQLKKGIIKDENEYELLFICKVITFDDGVVVTRGIPYVVQDNEINNIEDSEVSSDV